MAELNKKKLNTRISLKYDKLADWELNDPVLLLGEVAIVEIPNKTIHNDENSTLTPPAIAMKVGDGIKTFKQLGYTQAIAGDVYAWAKGELPPEAGTIPGLSDYLTQWLEEHAAEYLDTNTTYEIARLTEEVDGETKNKFGFVLSAFNKDGTPAGTTTIDFTAEYEAILASIKEIDENLEARVRAVIETDLNSAEAENKNEAGVSEVVFAVGTEKGIAKSTIRRALVEADLPAISQEKVTNLVEDLNKIREDFAKGDDDTLTAAKTYTDEELAKAIDALDVPVDTEGYNAAAGQMVDKIYEENGIVKVAYRDLTTREVKSVGADGAVTAGTLKDELDGINAELVRLEADKQDNLPFIGATEDAVPSKDDPVVLKSFIADIAANGINFRGVVDALPPVDNYKQGDLIIVNAESGAVEYILATSEGDEGMKWYELGDEGVHATKAEVKALSDRHDEEMKELGDKHDQEIKDLTDAYKKGDEDTLAAANAYTDQEIQALVYVAAEDEKNDQANPSLFIKAFDQNAGLIENVVYAKPVIDDIEGLPKALEDINTEIDTKEDKISFTTGATVSAALDGKGLVYDYVKEGDGANPLATKNYVDDQVALAIENLDYSVDVTEADKYKVLVGFDVADGVVVEDSVKTQEISKLAVSGKVEDLEQDDDDYFVLNCGSSIVNI